MQTLRFIGAGTHCHLRLGPDARNRGAQFMGRVSRKAAFRRHHELNALE